MDDHQIITLLFERNENGLCEIVNRYGRLLHRLAENITGSKEDGEECVNDAMLVLWQKIPPESPDPLAAYVLRIIRNLAIKRKRSNSAQKRSPGYTVSLDELADTLCTNANEADESELRASLNSFLLSLDSTERRLFVRRYWFSEEISVLAAEFSLSENAVKVRLHRTRNKLKHHLTKEDLIQ